MYVMKISFCARERCKIYFRSDNYKARSAAACRGMFEVFDRNDNRYFILLLSKWDTRYGKLFILFRVTLQGVLNTIIFFSSFIWSQRASINACFISIELFKSFRCHARRACWAQTNCMHLQKMPKEKTFWHHLMKYLYIFLRFFLY